MSTRRKAGKFIPERPIRRPPAFQEYGGDLLALEHVRLMSLAERGALATIRWALWANDSVPAHPTQLARVLGLDETELRTALTPRVLRFFAPYPDDLDRLHSPELTAQMERLMARRAKLSDAGHQGGTIRGQQHAVSSERAAQAEPKLELKQLLKPSEVHRSAEKRTALGKKPNIATTSKEDIRAMKEAFGEPCEDCSYPISECQCDPD